MAARQLDPMGRTADRRRGAGVPRRHRARDLRRVRAPPLARPAPQPPEGPEGQAAARAPAAQVAAFRCGRRTTALAGPGPPRGPRVAPARARPGIVGVLLGLLARSRRGARDDLACHAGGERRGGRGDHDGCRGVRGGPRGHRPADGTDHALRRGLHDRSRRGPRQRAPAGALHGPRPRGTPGELRHPRLARRPPRASRDPGRAAHPHPAAAGDGLAAHRPHDREEQRRRDHRADGARAAPGVAARELQGPVRHRARARLPRASAHRRSTPSSRAS
jgi:hypothetical protein